MPFSNDRYTVLGATGFIGSHLVAALRAQGREVYAPRRDDPELFRRDLGNVIYCVGLTADFRTRPIDTVRAHVCLLADVIEKAAFDTLLYLSSTRVYGSGGAGSETARLQVDPFDPSDLYNLSKLTGESLCRSCRRPGLKIARLSNVIGPDLQSANFFSALIREALSGRIVLQTDPASAKDYILLEDVLALLPRIGAEGKEALYNVASGINLSHREIVGALAALTGCRVELAEHGARTEFPILDIGRIRREFGFRPTPVLDRLPELLEQYRNAPAQP